MKVVNSIANCPTKTYVVIYLHQHLINDPLVRDTS